jgi:hypothetical protein
MKLQIADLTTERQWRAAIGADQARFEKLLILFTASYLALFGHSVAHRQADLEVMPSLQSERELLFFTLFSLKVGLTYDALGFVSGMDAANAKRNQVLGLQVLEACLRTADYLPKRSFANAAEFAEYLQHEETLIFDGIEQQIQRPGDNETQKAHYSGKKVPHSQSSDAEYPGAQAVVRQSVLGRQDARLSDVSGRISPRAAVVRALSPAGGPGLFRHRDRL